MLIIANTSDFAWNNYRAHHRYTESMKERIEEKFKQDMMDVCSSKSQPQRFICTNTAKIYALCVRKYPRNKATDLGP
jgi:hypothetical protein